MVIVVEFEAEAGNILVILVGQHFFELEDITLDHPISRCTFLYQLNKQVHFYGGWNIFHATNGT